jgi:hypothetical protein
MLSVIGAVRGVNSMNFYLKNSLLGAIHIEFASYLGIRPLYSFSKWKNEFIVEFPWLRIILTPKATLKTEKDFIKNGETKRPKTTSTDESVTGHSSPYPEN